MAKEGQNLCAANTPPANECVTLVTHFQLLIIRALACREQNYDSVGRQTSFET